MSLLGLLMVPQRGVTTFCPFFVRFGLLRKATEHLGWLAWSQESIGRKRTATEARKSGGLRCIRASIHAKHLRFMVVAFENQELFGINLHVFQVNTPPSDLLRPFFRPHPRSPRFRGLRLLFRIQSGHPTATGRAPLGAARTGPGAAGGALRTRYSIHLNT